MLIRKVCQALADRHVAYAVVGGFAVALHGAVRGTMDLDLVIRLELESFEGLEAAMTALGFRSKLPVTAEQVFHFREEYVRHRNLVAWSFFHATNAAEIVDVIITHDLRKMSAVSKDIGGQKIQLLCLEDLIAMKEGTGRAQDAEDCRALKEILKARQP